MWQRVGSLTVKMIRTYYVRVMVSYSQRSLALCNPLCSPRRGNSYRTPVLLTGEFPQREILDEKKPRRSGVFSGSLLLSDL